MRIYNEVQLQEKILGELKVIAEELKVKPPGDARIKANWILVILGAMPSGVTDTSPKETQLIPHGKHYRVFYQGNYIGDVGKCEKPYFAVGESWRVHGEIWTIAHTKQEAVELLKEYADKFTSSVANFHSSDWKLDNGATSQTSSTVEKDVVSDQKVETDANKYTLLPAGATKTQVAYKVRHQGLIIGLIFHLEGKSWQCGDGQSYQYPRDAIEGLQRLYEAAQLKAHPQKYESLDAKLRTFQQEKIGLEKLPINNKDRLYYASYYA